MSQLKHMVKMKYPIRIIPGDDGWYTVEVPDLPGCVTQGKTIEEAEKNAVEAIELWIKVTKEDNDPIPLPTIEEVVEVNV